MMEAVITFDPPEYWIRDVIESYDVTIKVIRSKVVKDDEVRDLVEIIIHNDEDPQKVIEGLEVNPYITKVDISSIERNRILAAFTTVDCTVCRTLAFTECFLTSSSTTDDGKMEWTLLVTERSSLQELMNDLDDDGVSPQLNKLTQISDKDALTARQEQITRMAYELGYFDFPRRIGLKELAQKFQISTSTLSEILRKGQRHILSMYFRENRH